MKKFLYKIWSKFLTAFGDIKIFKYPFWVVYDPDYFQMTGEKILDAVSVLKPGDIVIRGYQYYLDGKFINGDYSHAGIYVGNNTIIHAVAPHVEKINVVDFMECDRIAICRPHKGQKDAVRLANKYLNNKIPYDFAFNSKDVSALYCFELAAKCYPTLKIDTFNVKKFFGLIKKEAYLADSFKLSKDMTTIFEYNPKRCVDYMLQGK